MRLSVDLDEPGRLVLKLEGIGDRRQITVNGTEVRPKQKQPARQKPPPPAPRAPLTVRPRTSTDSVMDRDEDPRCSPGKVRDLLTAGPLSAHLISMRLGFRNTSKHTQALLSRMVDDGDLRVTAGSKAGTQYAIDDGGT